MPLPTLLMLHGPPAVGKHTIGRLLSARIGWPLFHNHLAVDLALSLFPFGSPGFVALRDVVWMEAFSLSLGQGQSLIFTFSPESSVPEDFLERLQSGAEAAGGQVVFVALTCSELVLEARMGMESRRAFGKLTDAGLYRRLRGEGVFDPPVFPAPLLTVDTSALSPPESAARIAAAVAPLVG